MFEVDSNSNVSLTGLTFSGGDGAVRVNGESFAEVIDCTFRDNNRTSSNFGGGLTVRISSKYHINHAFETAVFNKHLSFEKTD